MIERIKVAKVPLGLFAVAILAYGVTIPWLGLYGDDLPYLWIYHAFGAEGYPAFVAWDRPFSAWVYLIFTPIFGESIWPYHLLMVVLRWLCAATFWWVLEKVWPEGGWLNAGTALLFLVYPGFQQQPIPFEFMVHFFVLALFFLSLLLMLQSTKSDRRWFWTLNLAGALGAAGMFSMEYFVGIDLLRPVLLWIVLIRQGLEGKNLIKRISITWLPYLMVWVGFVYWRIFIFKFTHYQPRLVNDLMSNSFSAVVGLAKRILLDIRTVTYGAWRQILKVPDGGQALLIYALLVSVSLVLIWVLLSWFRKSKDIGATGWALPALVIGALALLLGGIPLWLPQLPVESLFPWDRSSLGFMVGSALAVAGLINWILKPHFQILALSAIVAMSVGFHYQNAMIYRDEWKTLQSFYWQLAWRAPGLKPGTILLSGSIPLYRYSDTNMTAFVNWTYAPNLHTTRIPYFVFDLDSRANGGLPALAKGVPVKEVYRSLTFESNTSNVLVFSFQPPACLRLLSPDDVILSKNPPGLEQFLPLSDLTRVEDHPEKVAVPPPMLAEPIHGWCYYFEKAEQAKQAGNWPEVVRLGDEAEQIGLQPTELSEWLTFLEGYGRFGKWEKASKLAEAVTKENGNKPALCGVWTKLGKEASSNPETHRWWLNQLATNCR